MVPTCLLGLLVAILDPQWAIFGHLGVILGRCWPILAQLAHLGAILDHLGAILALLGAIYVYLRVFLGASWLILAETGFVQERSEGLTELIMII